MGEFDLIRRYFERPLTAQSAHGTPEHTTRDRTTHDHTTHDNTIHDHVKLGIGDDCALLQPTPGMRLAISSDMLVEGRHFLSTVDPVKLGHKALAVNLSDLAACGARPIGFTLALALPSADPVWLEGFSRGLFALADAHACPLVGGDTTRGPLNICITVFGEVPPDQALLRSGARAGDDLWVSGGLGLARVALEVFRGNLSLPDAAFGPLFTAARARMEAPTPRVALGLALRGIASAAIDISDGLLGDLGHVLRASGVGAQIDAKLASKLIANYDTDNAENTVLNQTSPSSPVDATALSTTDRLRFVLSGGDDYELAFTAPPHQRTAVLAAGHDSATRVTRVGVIEALATGSGADGSHIRIVNRDGTALHADYASFDHFK